MPDKTIYSLTDKGKQEFVATLQQSILSFDYDTNIFSIAAFFIDALDDPLTNPPQLLVRTMFDADFQTVGCLHRLVEVVAVCNDSIYEERHRVIAQFTHVRN